MEKYRAIPEGYMRVGELAKKTGVNTNTLRYYDKEGLLSPSGLSDGGYRLYTDKDMAKLLQILTMKQLGFTLDEIKKHLVSLDTPGDMINALEEHEAAIEKKMAQLSKILKDIRALKSEVHQMQTMNFRKYADILRNLQMDNEDYWVIKHMDDDVLNHLRNHFDEDSVFTFMEATKRIRNEAAKLMKAGALPENEKSQAMAKSALETMMDATGGDEDLLARFADFLGRISDADAANADEFIAIHDFIRKAVEVYLKKMGNDPIKQEEN